MSLEMSAPCLRGREAVTAVLERRPPPRFAYGPNYWQWFQHQMDLGTLPPEIAHCRSQLEVIRWLGLDVFSRNVYCDPKSYWFGGLCDVVWDGVGFEEEVRREGQDQVIERRYRTARGTLRERLRFIHTETTLVQEKFLVDDPEAQRDCFFEVLRARRWKFVPERYEKIRRETGDLGLVMAGELFSPLKMLHLAFSAPATTFLLMDHPVEAGEMVTLHEAAQLDLVRQIAQAGVPALISMDNLDTAFHTPKYVERCSASFYEQASRICHEHGSTFFIHACGRQKANLALISSLGVDGLEGVAFPTLGDVELDEAMEISGDRMIVTGGISAQQFEALRSRSEIFAYTRSLLARMRPHAHRFVLGASCTTPYNAPWESILHFRDAWREYGGLDGI